ncbi:MAG: PDZ domain-containing protein [Hyphomonas sp.]
MKEVWNMRSLLIGTGIGLVLGATAVGLSALAAPQDPGPSNDPRTVTYQQLELFAEILARARQDYVTEIDEPEAMEAAINGMLTSLDPHSGYLNADDFKSMQVQTSGEYGGLGIEVTMEDGFVKVISPMDDTPASRAGIQPGDLITAIDGKPIIGQTLNDAVKEMRGEKGTEIVISILREGQDPFDVTLVREVIEQKSVTWQLDDNDIGYIRISTFNERTTPLLEAASKRHFRQDRRPARAA